MIRRTLSIALAALAAGRAGAQRPRVTVSGVAWDSLHAAPLAGAMISIAGTPRSTLADSSGRFHFDSLPPGTYTFAAQHDVVDSLGLSVVSARVTIAGGSERVVIAVPSFGAFWRTACPGNPPRDSGLVFGTVRSSRGGRAVAGSTVDITWMTYGVGADRRLAQRRWHNSVNTDSTGTFAICGVPDGVASRVRGATDSLATGLIDLPATTDRVRRRDLVVGPGSDAPAAERGAVAGKLSGVGGRAVSGARILMDEVPEVRSGNDGTFLIPGAPAGTRQLSIQALGMTPVSLVVDVVARDTVRVNADLKRVTTLSTVQVNEAGTRNVRVAAIAERKRSGLGQVADSASFRGRTTMATVLETFRGVNIQRVGGSKSQFLVKLRGQGASECLGTLFIDGQRRFGQEELWFLHPDEIAAVEVYTGLIVPPEFAIPRGQCGAIAVWTKYGVG